MSPSLRFKSKNLNQKKKLNKIKALSEKTDKAFKCKKEKTPLGVFVYIEAVDGLKTIDLSGFVGILPQIRPKFKQLGKFLLSAQSFYLLRLPSGASIPLG